MAEDEEIDYCHYCQVSCENIDDHNNTLDHLWKENEALHLSIKDLCKTIYKQRQTLEDLYRKLAAKEFNEALRQREAA